MAWTGTDAEFQSFIDEHGLTFPQISDDAATVYDHFGIAAQPALVVVDATGEVQTLFGAVDEATLDEILTTATT